MQEKNGYVFCLEERALLCRHCDVSNHMAESPYMSSHQRLLIADIKVSLQPSTNNIDNIGYSNTTNYPSSSSLSMSISANNFPADSESRTMTLDVETGYADNSASFLGEPHFSTECNWTLDEIFETNDFNYYELSDAGLGLSINESSISSLSKFHHRKQ